MWQSLTNYDFQEVNQRLPHGSTGEISTPAPSTSGPSTISAEVNAEKSTISGPTNQQPSSNVEGVGKKRSSNQGRVRGIGAVPKGRAPGWTGAGFDVDGRG